MESSPPDFNFKNFQPDPVEDYLMRLEKTVASIPRQEVWQVIRVIYETWQKGRTVYLCGNGGSAATASHMANDLNKLTISPGKPRLKAISLTDNVPLMTAWGNDTDYENIFAEQLLNFLEPGDVVIGISASGNSRNVLRAMEVARQHQAITVGFTGQDGGQLRSLVDYCVSIPDDHIGRQEDGHMILDHVIANTLKQLIASGD